MQVAQKERAKAQAFDNNNEKVLVIGNRLANIGGSLYRRSDCNDLTNSQTEVFLPKSISSNNNGGHMKKSTNSIHIEPLFTNSMIQQPFGTPLTKSVPQTPQSPSIPATPQIQEPPKQAPPSTPPATVRDDAQLVDFISSFMFPIVFIIFNIVYWMVYLNMHVSSGN